MRIPLILIGALACFLQTGCLKTRAQLKEDPETASENTAPQKAEIKDVHPDTGGYALDELKAEFTQLTGRIEELERAQKNAPAQKEDSKKLESRIIELEQAQIQMIEAIKKLEDRPAPGTPAAVAADPDTALARGKKEFEAKNYTGAIESFGAYLKAPKTKQAPEAHFFRGESYFLTKDYKKAILDFSKFPEKFTKSKYLPHALMRIAQSFESMGMKDDAKSFYQELGEKFPNSSEAKRVRSKLH